MTETFWFWMDVLFYTTMIGLFYWAVLDDYDYKEDTLMIPVIFMLLIIAIPRMIYYRLEDLVKWLLAKRV